MMYIWPLPLLARLRLHAGERNVQPQDQIAAPSALQDIPEWHCELAKRIAAYGFLCLHDFAPIENALAYQGSD